MSNFEKEKHKQQLEFETIKRERELAHARKLEQQEEKLRQKQEQEKTWWSKNERIIHNQFSKIQCSSFYCKQTAIETHMSFCPVCGNGFCHTHSVKVEWGKFYDTNFFLTSVCSLRCKLIAKAKNIKKYPTGIYSLKELSEKPLPERIEIILKYRERNILSL